MNDNNSDDDDSKMDIDEEDDDKVIYNYACLECRRVHKACSKTRPCKRCVKYGIADKCTSTKRKRRKGSFKNNFEFNERDRSNSLKQYYGHDQNQNDVIGMQTHRSRGWSLINMPKPPLNLNLFPNMNKFNQNNFNQSGHLRGNIKFQNNMYNTNSNNNISLSGSVYNQNTGYGMSQTNNPQTRTRSYSCNEYNRNNQMKFPPNFMMNYPNLMKNPKIINVKKLTPELKVKKRSNSHFIGNNSEVKLPSFSKLLQKVEEYKIRKNSPGNSNGNDKNSTENQQRGYGN